MTSKPTQISQFNIKTQLWLVVVAAGFLSGMALQRRLDEPEWLLKQTNMKPGAIYTETIRLRDGSKWHRPVAERS